MIKFFKPMLRLLKNNRGDVNPNPEPTPTPTPEPTPTDPPVNEFFNSLSEENRTLNTEGKSTLQKFNNADDLAKSYTELESKVGAKGILVPGQNATPEEKETFLNALGRPETPDGYKINSIEGLHESIKITPETESAFKTFAHKSGYNNDQVNELNSWYLNAISEQAKATDKAELEASQKAETALRAEWKENYDPTVKAVQELVLQVGGQEAVDAMGGVEGIGNNIHVLKMLGKITGMLSEDQMKTLRGPGGGVDGNESQEQANKKITEINHALANDPKSAIADASHVDHAKAVIERDRLYKIAFPGEGA